MNQQATIKAVKEFFFKDDYQHWVNYQRIERMVKIETFCDEVNGTYQQAQKVILKAVASCKEESHVLLQNRFIERQKVWQVKRLLFIGGQDTYYRRERQAISEFITALEPLKKEFEVSDIIVPNFHKPWLIRNNVRPPNTIKRLDET